ncbi:hypothetical protein C7S18_06155 [Ahniella affigens]|uniref:DUF7919 domain-containing protein n=1 Tax=Ahniella affigens TaxID=2021234 RepID=A0A2P1PPQ5_9GAMM|nr:hypothetical protein C7S18_06155 [Ahniella affigens]
MFFADLTPYEYGPCQPNDNLVNVGWLAREHPFASGEVPKEFLMALRKLVASPVNLYRGSHICELCPAPPLRLSPGGIPMLYPPPETTGNGEIRIRGLRGLVYVAPVLVAHYVEAHKYLPPAEFIEAVASSSNVAGA